MSVTVHHGDNRDILRGLPDNSIDSIVTDPPYALVSIQKRFGKPGSAPAKGDIYARASAGFMGKQWDTGEVAFAVEFWAEILRVLKPGGHVVAFSGTRTYHRLACAIEDAGFEMRDMIGWNFGSGFPKSHNVVRKLQESGLACRCPKTIVSSHHVCDENLHDLQRGLDAAQPLSGGSQSDVRAALCGGGDQSAGKGTTGEGFTLHSLRDLRDDGASPALSCGAVGGDVLQPVLPVQVLRGSAAPNGGEHEGQEGDSADGREEPGLEGRGDAQAPARKLQGRSLRQSAGVGATDGAEGRLHHGASARDGADVRLPADTDGSGQSRGPQPCEQSPVEPDALPDERGSQAWGGWPVCPGCLQPIVPEGYGTALKPAFEPVALARKPLGKGQTVAANVLAHGTGALNIDACRVGTETHVIKGGGGGAGTGWGEKREINEERTGRFPANVLHDGSDEVVGAFPLAPGQLAPVGPQNGAKASVNVYGDYGAREQFNPRGDTGSAARFFYTAEPDDLCGLCGCPSGVFSGKLSPCNANTAEPSSPTENTQIVATAPFDAAGSQPPVREVKNLASSGLATGAEPPSSRHRQADSDTAAGPAATPGLSSLAQNVKSAGSLCDSCATAIAQSLAATQRGQSPASLPCPASIDGRSWQILTSSLALHVEGRESTDTTTTIPSLKLLLGSVFHAIGDTTRPAKSAALGNTESGPKRFHYSSKADATDRLGSKHPTVKPTDLMRWLVRLVTPPGGTVLDPFAGSGSTGVACIAEGFDAILIEREDEYIADINRRIAWANGEGKLTAQELGKKQETVEALPLFGGAA